MQLAKSSSVKLLISCIDKWDKVSHREVDRVDISAEMRLNESRDSKRTNEVMRPTRTNNQQRPNDLFLFL